MKHRSSSLRKSTHVRLRACVLCTGTQRSLRVAECKDLQAGRVHHVLFPACGLLPLWTVGSQALPRGRAAPSGTPQPSHCLSRPFLQGHALLRGHPGPGCWQYLHSPEQIPTQVSRPRGRGLGGAGLRVPSVISLFSHPGMPWTSVTSTQSHLGVPSPPLSLGTSSACLRTH